MGKWLALGLVWGLAACGGGGEDEHGGDAMAKEFAGACVFTPGQYVLSYEVVDTLGCDGDIEPLTDEYITVLSNGSIAATGGTADPSCVESAPINDGCFTAFSRHCEVVIDGGSVVVADGDYEFLFSEGSGHVALTLRGYLSSGESVLTCRANMEGTIRRR